MNMKRIEPNDEQTKARLAMLDSLKAYNLEPMEMLALMSYTVGQLIAMQDQTKVTSEQAMAMFGENIEACNKYAIEDMMKSKGSS